VVSSRIFSAEGARVLEVSKELDLHDHCGCHLVSPAPNPLAVGNEARLAESTLQSGGVQGSALDLEVDLDDLRVATLPAYLLAKVHAARGRGLEKDWYDIAYVLLHNDDGGPGAAAQRVRDRFEVALIGPTETALAELAANFTNVEAQGSIA